MNKNTLLETPASCFGVPTLTSTLVSEETRTELCDRGFTPPALFVGAVFPSYRALAEALHEPVLSGNSRKAQLLRWETLFSWERTGNAYRVTQLHLSQAVARLQAHYPSNLPSGRLDWRTPCALSLLKYLQETPSKFPDPSPVFCHYLPVANLHIALGFPKKEALAEAIPAAFQPDLYRFLASLFSSTAQNLLRTFQRHCYLTFEPVVVGYQAEPGESQEQAKASSYRKSPNFVTSPSDYTLFVAATRAALDSVHCSSLWQVFERDHLYRFREVQAEQVQARLQLYRWTECYAIRYTESTLSSWLKWEAKRIGLRKMPEAWAGENTNARVSRWIQEYVEECARLGIQDARIFQELTRDELLKKLKGKVG